MILLKMDDVLINLIIPEKINIQEMSFTGSVRSIGKFLASRSSQTSRDTKLAFDIHIAMYLGYISSKDQLSRSTRLSSRLRPAKRPKKPAA